MTAVWILSALSLMLTAGVSAELSEGDTAWANRAVSLEDDLADPVQINRAIDPEHLGNRLILALALLDDTDEPSSQEASDLLHGIIDTEPQSHQLIEDLIIQRQARARLDGLDGTTP
ncbi:MAG: hypothetical protein VX528_13735 [Candidatus Latescibacterota bacterium]|nr:hypothetical protein [Candidatus Latescibacterota bacterium]